MLNVIYPAEPACSGQGCFRKLSAVSTAPVEDTHTNTKGQAPWNWALLRTDNPSLHPKLNKNPTLGVHKGDSTKWQNLVPEPYSGLAAWPPPVPWQSGQWPRGAPAAGSAWCPGPSSPWQCWGTQGWKAPELPGSESTAQSRFHGGSWKPAAAEQLLAKAHYLRGTHTAAESSRQFPNLRNLTRGEKSKSSLLRLQEPHWLSTQDSLTASLGQYIFAVVLWVQPPRN